MSKKDDAINATLDALTKLASSQDKDAAKQEVAAAAEGLDADSQEKANALADTLASQSAGVTGPAAPAPGTATMLGQRLTDKDGNFIDSEGNRIGPDGNLVGEKKSADDNLRSAVQRDTEAGNDTNQANVNNLTSADQEADEADQENLDEETPDDAGEPDETNRY